MNGWIEMIPAGGMHCFHAAVDVMTKSWIVVLRPSVESSVLDVTGIGIVRETAVGFASL